MYSINPNVRTWGHWLTIKFAQLYVAHETYVVGPLAEELFDFTPRLELAGAGHLNPTM